MNKTNKILLIAIILCLLFASTVIFIYLNLLRERNRERNELLLKTTEITEKLKSSDSDNDMLTDFDEIYVYKTNPNDIDTDKDGYHDGLELDMGFNPLDPIEKITIENPPQNEIEISVNEYEIKGSNSPIIDKIEIEIVNQQNERKLVTLDNFKKGDLRWSYVLKTDDNTLTEGKNLITILAYSGDETTKKEIIISEKLPLGRKEITIEVDWEKELIKQEQKCEEYCESESYLVGKIKSDPYKNYLLYLEVFQEMGTSYRHYIIEKNEKLYLEDNNIKIEGISDLPEEISFPESNYKLKKYYIGSSLFSEVKTIKKLFTSQQLGDFYLTEDGCIVAQLPDHTVILYDFERPFINKESGLLDITFNNKEKNEEEYEFYRDIPSFNLLCYYVNPINEKELEPERRLKVAGRASMGEIVYEFKNINDEYLKNLYNDKNTIAWEWTDENQRNKYTYEEFINLHPLLYWKDPSGRWIQFKNKKFARMAEMAKPVIYLYPEKEMKINVRVEPSGGLTLTVPEYNDGWNVEASRNRRIKDLKTGEEYDYLYWEGIGINYPIKNEGWVVKKENLDQFFNQKLSLLGLNEKEINDFKDYWVNRLSDLPYLYYKISFLTKEEFDSLAPLYFSPVEPDAVIRIMMTAQGLEQFESIPEQKLPKTPQRHGFTVVEWGGTLLK